MTVLVCGLLPNNSNTLWKVRCPQKFRYADFRKKCLLKTPTIVDNSLYNVKKKITGWSSNTCRNMPCCSNIWMRKTGWLNSRSSLITMICFYLASWAFTWIPCSPLPSSVLPPSSDILQESVLQAGRKSIVLSRLPSKRAVHRNTSSDPSGLPSSVFCSAEPAPILIISSMGVNPYFIRACCSKRPVGDVMPDMLTIVRGLPKIHFKILQHFLLCFADMLFIAIPSYEFY